MNIPERSQNIFGQSGMHRSTGKKTYLAPVQNTCNQNAQRSDCEMCSELLNDPVLQNKYDEQDQTLFYDVWNGHFNDIHYPVSDCHSPFVELDPVCQFERACKKKRLNRSLASIRQSQVIPLYYERMNEEEDEKTAQALYACEAIRTYPGCDE